MTTQKTPGWFSEEEKAQHKADYENELVRRYEAGLSLSKEDKKEARKILKARGE